MTQLLKKRLDTVFKVKEVSETGEFSGYGSVFGVKDSYSDIVIKGAFEKSLLRWKDQGNLPALLWQHKMDEPIGIYTKMEEDENGLYVEGRLLIEDDPLAKRAHSHLKAGSISGLSIGYALQDYEMNDQKDAFILKEIDLWEVSLVTFPANDQARVETVKSSLLSGEIPSPRDFEKALRDVMGLSQNQAKRLMSEGFKGLRDVDAKETDSFEQLIKRINQI